MLKKYISLKSELSDLQVSLLENPEQGTLLWENVYKIRMGVKSKGRGKSGGVRIITFVETLIVAEIEVGNNQQKVVNLVAIYDKADTATIEQHEIEMFLSETSFDED